MIVIAEYHGNVEIYTDVNSVEDRYGELCINPDGPDVGFDRATIIPVWQDIDIGKDEIEAMIREYIEDEYRRIRDERIADALQEDN